MSYLLESLSEGEEIKKEFRLHKILWIPPVASFFLGVLAAGTILFIATIFGKSASEFMNPALLVFLAFLIGAVYLHLSLVTQEQGVTNKRVVKKTGLVARNTQEISLKALETVEIKQSILGRMLGFGSVEVTGRGAAIIKFNGLSKPLDVKRSIENEAHKIAIPSEVSESKE